MSKFTKGKWRFNQFGDILCEAGYTLFSKDGANDNDVRLAAAVPEMYNVLLTNAHILDTLIQEYELFDDPDISWLNDHLDTTEKLLARIDGTNQYKIPCLTILAV